MQITWIKLTTTSYLEIASHLVKKFLVIKFWVKILIFFWIVDCMFTIIFHIFIFPFRLRSFVQRLNRRQGADHGRPNISKTCNRNFGFDEDLVLEFVWKENWPVEIFLHLWGISIAWKNYSKISSIKVLVLNFYINWISMFFFCILNVNKWKHIHYECLSNLKCLAE